MKCYDRKEPPNSRCEAQNPSGVKETENVMDNYRHTARALVTGDGSQRRRWGHSPLARAGVDIDRRKSAPTSPRSIGNTPA